MIKAILFDFDDTLVKTLEIKTKALQITGKKYYGLTISDQEIKKHWGIPFKQLMKTIYKGVKDIEEVIGYYTIERQNFPSPAYEDVIESLYQFSKNYLLGIITSHTRRYIYHDLETAKIPKKLFFTVQTGEDTKYHKPDPRVFNFVLDKLEKKGIGKSSIIYVGDSLIDYLAAHDAGIGFYGISGRTTDKKQFDKVKAKTLKNLGDLGKILKK